MLSSFQKYILFALLLISSLFSQSIQPKRFIAVTFDDLPINTKYLSESNQWIVVTEKIIAAINKYRIPAIGFVNESKLFVDEKLDSTRLRALSLWIEANLELGNHTYSHSDYNNTDEKVFFEDITNGEKITKKLLAEKNKKLTYFRHPYLHTGNTSQKKIALEKFLEKNSYKITPVTIDNGEWIFARAYENAFHNNNLELMKNIGNGYVSYMIDKTAYFENQSIKLFGYEIKQILLVHANMLNADYFDELAEQFLKRNYEFISIDEALGDPAYLSDDNYTGRGGISWLHRWSYTKKVDKIFFAGEPEVSQDILDIAGIESE